MATVAHYIYSHYDPPKRDNSPVQSPEETSDNESDPWQTESAFGVENRLARAPQFVKAVVSYDEINDMIGSPSVAQQRLNKEEGEKATDVAGWYRSLTGGSNTPAPGSGTSTTLSSRAETPLDVPPPSSTLPVTSKPKPTVNKNDWFICKVLESEPISAPATPPTLADLLSREPPASNKQDALQPPVFLAIGPSNRGFTMLERSGWSEGEALGPHVTRKGRMAAEGSNDRGRVKREQGQLVVREEHQEVHYGSYDDVSEVRKVEVVDLTMSDDEDSDEEDTDMVPQPSDTPTEPLFSHDGKALITPLPTILKSDRLGIGLKAKTIGPYRMSKKRVTHNQAALAAHLRTTEETKLLKKVMGRGTRAFSKAAKAESEQRRQMLASLNEP
ncbi:hypothetical protein BXZ70DRAFT_1005204 [Cristinia sonorae]|uniref:G-patch domain-containing protein n=1 Tax=Cristinia sonorae TaxID=1940300 RepID=A0A8K0UWW2_9AGAR|nr:hypothetical protein BXZ70DRAFT_1005204 [Cristinia sonorae]